MNILELIGAFIGIPIGLLGIAGGLLNLRESFIKWRKDRRRHGSKGSSVLSIGKTDKESYTEYHFLIVGDLWQFLYPLMNDTSARVESISLIGEYYELKIRCDPGTDLAMRIKKRK